MENINMMQQEINKVIFKGTPAFSICVCIGMCLCMCVSGFLEIYSINKKQFCPKGSLNILRHFSPIM